MHTQSSQSPDLLSIRRALQDSCASYDGLDGIACALDQLATALYDDPTPNVKGVSVLLNCLQERLTAISQQLNQLADNI